jgi:hypothetical protein
MCSVVSGGCVPRFFLIALTSAIVVGGCGSGDNKSSDSNKLAIVGAWAQDCAEIDANHSSREFLEASSTTSTSFSRYYGDAACSTLAFYTNSVGQLSLTSSTYDSVSGADKLTIASTDFITEANSSSFCGSTDWIVDTPRDIAERECTYSLDGPTSISFEGAAANLHFFGSYKVDGDVLSFAATDDTRDGTSANNRAVTFKDQASYKYKRL